MAAAGGLAVRAARRIIPSSSATLRTFSSSPSALQQEGASSLQQRRPNTQQQQQPHSRHRQYQQQQQQQPQQQEQQQPRSKFDSLSAIGAPVYQNRNSNSSSNTSSAKAHHGPLRDTDIRSEFIYLVDYTGAAGGGLTGPHRTSDILTRLDRKNFWLQQVSARPGSTSASRSRKVQQEGQGEGDGEGEGEGELEVEEKRKEERAPYPVCKIVAKKDEFDHARAAAKRKAEAKSTLTASSSSTTRTTDDSTDSATPSSTTSGSVTASHKDLQVTWSSTPHDISYKLAKAKRELLARAPQSRLTIRIVTKRGSGRNVGTPGTAGYVAELGRKQAFLDEMEAALCEGGEGEKVARLSSEGVQWQRDGSTAVLVYEPITHS